MVLEDYGFKYRAAELMIIIEISVLLDVKRLLGLLIYSYLFMKLIQENQMNNENVLSIYSQSPIINTCNSTQ